MISLRRRSSQNSAQSLSASRQCWVHHSRRRRLRAAVVTAACSLVLVLLAATNVSAWVVPLPRASTSGSAAAALHKQQTSSSSVDPPLFGHARSITRSRPSATSLESSKEKDNSYDNPSDEDNNDNNIECTIYNLEDCLDPEQKEKVRMEAVRMLQNSFYQSTTDEDDNDNHTELKEPTLENGGVLQLPLWRVPWTEVPGRTNVLSVQEPMYTNMFEELIRSSSSSNNRNNNNGNSKDDNNNEDHAWYFGHLYVPKETSSLTSVHLSSYEDIIELDVADDERSAAVLGTLMKITDYRRMEDGKLLLLVQAVERFVVTEILQEKPHGVARVQLLPDREEIQLPKPKLTANSNSFQPSLLYTERVVQPARASAVVESWQQWHPYEYESTPFPLPVEENLPVDKVVGSALAKVLPYAPFDTAHLPTDRLLKPPSMQRQEQASARTASATRLQNDGNDDNDEPPQKPLEVCLLEAGILKEVGVPDSLLQMPLGQLESNLWLALNDFLVSSRTPVSPVLLGLLPVGQSWPSEFVLERIADTIGATTTTATSSSAKIATNSINNNNNNKSNGKKQIEHKYRRVSPLYPSLRRQKRLAYGAAQLLERRMQDSKNELRQKLLQIPSTKLRLAYILWMFETEYGAWK